MTTHSILLAEDEAMVRAVAFEFLEEAGFKVHEAPDGLAALAILKSGVQIDLLVSDVKMPGMNGYELVQAGVELKPDLRVILMTGYAEDPPAHIKNRAGLKILHKPFDFDALVAMARRSLTE